MRVSMHPAPVRALLALADVCKRGLCAVGAHAWRPTRSLISTLDICERPGCYALRDTAKPEGR